MTYQTFLLLRSLFYENLSHYCDDIHGDYASYHISNLLQSDFIKILESCVDPNAWPNED